MSRHKMPAHWNSIQEASYRTVHEFERGSRRGASALAPLVGKSPRVLDNEINPDVTSHKLGFEDAAVIMHAAEDYRMLYTLAAELGHSCIELADFSAVSDVELLSSYAAHHKELGETAAAIHLALEDGAITLDEFQVIKREGEEDIRAWFAVLARLEALIDEE